MSIPESVSRSCSAANLLQSGMFDNFFRIGEKWICTISTNCSRIKNKMLFMLSGHFMGSFRNKALWCLAQRWWCASTICPGITSIDQTDQGPLAVKADYGHKLIKLSRVWSRSKSNTKASANFTLMWVNKPEPPPPKPGIQPDYCWNASHPQVRSGISPQQWDSSWIISKSCFRATQHKLRQNIIFCNLKCFQYCNGSWQREQH